MKMDFETTITIFFIVYWMIVYLLFHWFKTDKSKPVYKMVSYWITSILTSFGIWIVGIFVFLNAILGSSDYTVSDIKYGKEVLAGENDGLMYTDRIKLYDNNTFHILSHQIESNGYYSILNDTVKLEYNKEYDKTILPDLYVIKGKGMYGYSFKGSIFDSSWDHYFGIYKNEYKH